jgi:two-component system, NtrC family, nitrogen regulation sensor histidine kinase GlnL
MTAINDRQLLDALPNPILVLGRENRVVYANNMAEDYFQTSATALCRLSLADLVPLTSPVLQSVAQLRDIGGALNEYDVTIGSPRHGGVRLADLQSAVMVDVPDHVVIMVLRRSIAQKFELQLSHRGAARSVSAMASIMAHEIKNPLAGIRGAAQLLEPALEESDRALARLICDETDRIRDLVDQMEVFSDERPLDKKPVNIHVVLDRVHQLISASSGNAVRLSTDYDPSLPQVHGNLDQLVQVFLNLVKNAVEAMEQSGGDILLTTAFRPGIRLAVAGSPERVSLPLEVCVHDQGGGIPDDIRPHVFDPFVTSKPKGKGLGLALVAKIVRDHGGVVEAMPREGGTTFRVLLPLTPELGDASYYSEREKT